MAISGQDILPILSGQRPDLVKNISNKINTEFFRGQNRVSGGRVVGAIQEANQNINEAARLLEKSYGGVRSQAAVRSNIDQQIAHIVDMGGYSRPTRFHIEIMEFPLYVNERLSRNCMTTSLPGRGLQSQPLKIYGPPMEYVYETNYQNELQMTFRVGSDMFERVFFEDWMNAAYSNITADVEYPDAYRRSLKLYQLDMVDRKVLCIRLDDVFCKSVGDIELSTDASDQIETVTVTIGYTEYQIIGKLKIDDDALARSRAMLGDLAFLKSQMDNKPLNSDIRFKVSPGEYFDISGSSNFLRNTALPYDNPAVTIFAAR